MYRGFQVLDHALKGKKVAVKGSVVREGIVLGTDVLGATLVGLTKTSLMGMARPKPGKQFISIFHAKDSQLEVIG